MFYKLWNLKLILDWDILIGSEHTFGDTDVVANWLIKTVYWMRQKSFSFIPLSTFIILLLLGTGHYKMSFPLYHIQ